MLKNIWWLPGGVLIFLGLMIFIYPELLAFIVATALIGSGFTLLMWGRTFRQAVSRSNFMTYQMHTTGRSSNTPEQIYHD